MIIRKKGLMIIKG